MVWNPTSAQGFSTNSWATGQYRLYRLRRTLEYTFFQIHNHMSLCPGQQSITGHTAFTHSLWKQFRVSYQAHVHVFGPWEKSRASKKKPTQVWLEHANYIYKTYIYIKIWAGFKAGLENESARQNVLGHYAGCDAWQANKSRDMKKNISSACTFSICR